MDEVLDALAAAGVERLIDVRAVASSRRPGFSKTALAAALGQRGIEYLHLRPLGTPAAGRQAARAGRTREMRVIYADHLETHEAELALVTAVAAAEDKPSALLCYEAEAAGCHRTMLAEYMVARRPFEVRNL